MSDGWLPSSDNLNALPEPLRKYVHDLETRCDPAGDVARLALTQDENRRLRAEHVELKRERDEFDKAYIEEDGLRCKLLIEKEELATESAELRRVAIAFARGKIGRGEFERVFGR